jgi:Cyclopropane fatty acid synthase and related methyltransferases
VEGITLSKPQADWGRARIAEAGLASTAKIELRDYREIALDSRELYNSIVSVGMAEHVGRGQLPAYFAAAHRALKPGGIFLNQAIGENIVARPGNRNGSFIEQYVFPDGDILPLPVMLRAAETAHFEIRDVENLREHYALTLRHWLRRLETKYDNLCNWLTNQRIACGVFILPARPTDFAAGILQFIKRCSRSWIHPDRATCLLHETIGTRTIPSR